MDLSLLKTPLQEVTDLLDHAEKLKVYSKRYPDAASHRIKDCYL